MARRVVGERKGKQLSNMLLVGDPRPVKLDGIPSLQSLPLEYRNLRTTWGPGVAFGTLEFADPTDAVGVFVQWQRRCRIQLRHLIAINHRMRMDEAAVKTATVSIIVNVAVVIAACGSFMTWLDED